MTTTRFTILAVTAAALLAGLYASMDTIMRAAQVTLTVRDLVFPPPKPPTPAPAVAVSPGPLSAVGAKFQSSLLLLDGEGIPRAMDRSRLAGVKYWAFYYSASWCPPCRAFTPDLVSFYRDFKPSHPDFELIFVNDDRSEDDMLSYMKNDAMPWPAVWYSELNNPELDARKYCGEGIPCLVLVDADGQVLSDTFQGGQYTDPHHVIDDIRSMVR